jgi:hypothetical protein
VIGKPLHVKTDNGPGYTSTAFKAFCSSYKISYHRHTLQSKRPSYIGTSSTNIKVHLQKQEGGDSSPATQIDKALFTLNFLNCSESGFTAAEKHQEHCNKQCLPQVLWKDVMTGAWQGPSLVLLWGQGHAYVFPEGTESPIWVPSQFVQTHGTNQPSDAEAPPDRGGEKPNPAENQTDRDLITESDKELLTGPTRGNIITLTNTVKQPGDLLP